MVLKQGLAQLATGTFLGLAIATPMALGLVVTLFDVTKREESRFYPLCVTVRGTWT